MITTGGFRLGTFGLTCLAIMAHASIAPRAVNGELHLGSLFTNHMVLQRDMPIPIWGTGEAGAVVEVTFASQVESATIDANGQWMLELDSLGASAEPRTLTVTSKLASQTESHECTDVLVGEVWICSGQSNMQFGVKSVPEVRSLIPNLQNIRSFTVERTVAFDPQQFCEGAWLDVHPDSAVALSFAHSLQKITDVPVGIILSCWGSSSIEAWMPRDMTETVPHFQVMMDEFDANTDAHQQINAALNGPQPWSRSQDVFLRRQSNILFNAMMHPLAPFACRGLVWYQGERNTQSMHGMLNEPWYSRNSGMLRYGEVLKQWILRYRQLWNRDDFHFLVVMLPGFGGISNTTPDIPDDNPAAHSWAWMRESQLKALELSHTGIANTIDLGDAKNIHPRDKFPIGERLALLAARDTLNLKIEAEGPTLRDAKANGDTIIIHFEDADGLTTTDGENPRGFWLADDAGHWVTAEAKIEGDSVTVQSIELPHPHHVRYGFVGKPDVNLVNESNLPAVPFRTDQFAP